MPTTAWSVALPDIMRELGFISTSTTTNIVSGVDVVSTNLADDYDQDNYFNRNWWIKFTSGNNSGKVRRITDYTASTGTLVVAGAALTAESGLTNFELMRFHPDTAQDHFNRARQELFPFIAIVRSFEGLASGQFQHRYILPTTLRGKPDRVMLGTRRNVESLVQNLSADGGFETWTNTTTLTNFTLTGTGASSTQEQETVSPKNYVVLAGANSARVLTSSSAITVTTLLETVTPDQGIESVELNVSVWGYCMSASRLSASADGTLGTTHGGTGWERMVSSKTLDNSGTTFTWGISLTAAGTRIVVYIDEGIPTLGQQDPYDHGWDELKQWTWIPPVAGASNNGFLEFPYALPEKQIIRVIARDLLSSVSADTDTIEIDGELLAPLYDYTRLLMAKQVANESVAGTNDWWARKVREYQASVDRHLNNGRFISLPNVRAKVPDA